MSVLWQTRLSATTCNSVHVMTCIFSDAVIRVSEFGEAIQEEDFEAFVDCDKEAECFGNLTDAEICD